MRAGPNAQVVAKLPVIQIMKATVAGFGIGRDLIALHARLSCHLGDAVEHGVGQVFLRYHRRKLGKVGVGLNGQVVNRDVGRTQGQCLAHVFFEACQGLAGQGVHDVQVKGLKTGSGLFHRSNGLRAVMHPAQRFQVRVIEALNADRQACHARAAKGFETVFFKGPGVGFQRDFAVSVQSEASADVGQQPVNRRR